jgi:small-conductance mechanosensitive channel
MVAINAVGLTIAADLLNKVVLYIPNIIAAIFILIIGMFVATVLRNIVQAAANNAGLDNSKFLAKVVDVAVTVFAAIVALEQLGIGNQTISLLITIVLGSLGLGLALAIGLGCKDLVGRTVSDFVDKLKKK